MQDSSLGAEESDRSEEEDRLVEGLRSGDETAFIALIDRYQQSLTRFARLYLRDPEAVRDVVQETWLAVFAGIGRFRARSSLKTWLFSILVRRACSRARRDGRSTTFSAAWSSADEPTVGAVAPERFLPADHPRWPGHWASEPTPWLPQPQRELLSQEAFAVARRAVAELPPAQREVIILRDVEGCSSRQARDVLGVTEANQRVLLHRARSRVRAALDAYYSEGKPA